MMYYCPKCKKFHTLPHGDYLIEKNKECSCGEKASAFFVIRGTPVNIDWKRVVVN